MVKICYFCIMSVKKCVFLGAQCVYALLVLLALLAFPGASVVPTLLAMLAVWFIVAICYKYIPWKSEVGWWTLLASTSILAVGVIANVHYFTTYSGATTQLPLLHNPDAWRYYYDALSIMGDANGVPCELKSHGYGLIISWVWQLTGITIVSPLVLNMLLILFSIIVSGGIAWRLLHGVTSKSGQWIASCAMIMTASVCYFLNSGTLLLKEAGVIFAFSLIGFSLISQNETSLPKWTDVVLFFIGAVLMAMLRTNYLIMPIVGVAILLRWNKWCIIKASTMLVITVACWIGVSAWLYSSYSEASEIASKIMSGYGLNNSFFLDNLDHRTYNAIVEGYFDFPWWKKVLFLPMSAAVQYLIPLPWGFCDDIQFGYSLAYAHISYPWYLVGGLILYFVVCHMRKAPRTLARFIMWGGLMWLVPAFLFAGTVSRYALPMLPILVPGAVYVVAKWREFNKSQLKWWFGIYALLLFVGLIAGYIVQKGVAL